MAKLVLFQKVADNAAIALNDPWLDAATADGLYLEIDGTNDMTGPLTLADNTNAIESGGYAIQLKSGVADGATAIGYTFDTTNKLDTAGSIVYQWKTGGAGLFDLYFEVGGGTLGYDALVFDSSSLDAGSELLGALKFITPGAAGYVTFAAPSAASFMGINPGSQAFTTSRTGAAGDAATINMSQGNGTTAMIRILKETGVGAFLYPPNNEGYHLGRNTANTSTNKFGELFLRDNGSTNFGNNADAEIYWDTTDLVIDPDVNVAGGVVKVNSASSWSAAGAVALPALLLPAAATGVGGQWLTIKDNAGVVHYIPAYN